MDFPTYLETLDFIDGNSELTQDLYLALKSDLGDFLFDPAFGLGVDVHVQDLPILDYKLEEFLSKFPGVKIVGINTTKSNKGRESITEIRYSYNGKITSFNYNDSK